MCVCVCVCDRPLHDAIEVGSLEVVQLLIEHGADPLAELGEKTPLEYALMHNQLEIYDYLQCTPTIDRKSSCLLLINVILLFQMLLTEGWKRRSPRLPLTPEARAREGRSPVLPAARALLAPLRCQEAPHACCYLWKKMAAQVWFG